MFIRDILLCRKEMERCLASAPWAYRWGQGEEQKGGREKHTQPERERKTEIDKDREREGETETQTESKSECVSLERRSRLGQDTILLVQMASHIPVRPLGNLAVCFLSYPASTPTVPSHYPAWLLKVMPHELWVGVYQ